MKKYLQMLIEWFILFITPGKGTYIRIYTDKYKDSDVRQFDVGIICKKELQKYRGKKIPVITIDFGYRLLVCSPSEVKKIRKKEYVNDPSYYAYNDKKYTENDD